MGTKQKTSVNSVEKVAVTEEVAIKELVEFYNYYALEPLEEIEILEGMNIAKLAIIQGLLTFDEDLVPTYKLKNPIKNDKGEISLSEIKFKTRIFPKDNIRLSKGLNISKQTFEYSMRCMAFLAGLSSSSYMNKFSKFDYTVIQQVGTVFA